MNEGRPLVLGEALLGVVLSVPNKKMLGKVQGLANEENLVCGAKLSFCCSVWLKHHDIRSGVRQEVIDSRLLVSWLTYFTYLGDVFETYKNIGV